MKKFRSAKKESFMLFGRYTTVKRLLILFCFLLFFVLKMLFWFRELSKSFKVHRNAFEKLLAIQPSVSETPHVLIPYTREPKRLFPLFLRNRDTSVHDTFLDVLGLTSGCASLKEKWLYSPCTEKFLFNSFRFCEKANVKHKNSTANNRQR